MKQFNTPDWPPRASAIGLPDEHSSHGSTGQFWIVKNGQWIRQHASDCAVHNEPAMPAAACDCGGA